MKTYLLNNGKDRSQVLIVDVHDMHNFVELLTAAVDNYIEMPAHCSQWLQPLDHTMFGPLKIILQSNVSGNNGYISGSYS